MRTARLIESQAKAVRISATEAAALNRAGRRLASEKTHWNAAQAPVDRTVITCEPGDAEHWWVTVRDAIGVVAIEPDLQLIVDPKIPTDHFVYLAEKAETVPRLDPQRTVAAKAASWWELLAEWFVAAATGVLRRDLLKDYEEVQTETPAVRGALRPVESAALFYAGRAEVLCAFDEYGPDTPLNRVLRSAARAIQGNPYLGPAVRRNARRLTLRMEDVGDLRPGDLQTAVDRRSHHYADAIQLARHILTHQGRTLDTGQHPVWTFLIHTPPVVEEGLRAVAQDAGIGEVDNRGMQLPGSRLTLNPDLVFREGNEAVAVADVKYKISTGEWKRGDLYQAVTFATGYRVACAAILEFETTERAPLITIRIGDVALSHLTWPATNDTSPAEAHQVLVAALRLWRETFTQSSAA